MKFCENGARWEVAQLVEVPMIGNLGGDGESYIFFRRNGAEKAS